MLLSVASSFTQARPGHDNNVQDDDGDHKPLSDYYSHTRMDVV